MTEANNANIRENSSDVAQHFAILPMVSYYNTYEDIHPGLEVYNFL